MICHVFGNRPYYEIDFVESMIGVGDEGFGFVHGGENEIYHAVFGSIEGLSALRCLKDGRIEIESGGKKTITEKRFPE